MKSKVKILKKDIFCLSFFLFLFLFSLFFLDKFTIPKIKALDIFFYLFKEIYSYIILAILICLAFIYLNRKHKSNLKKEFLSLATTILLVFFLKFLISRERPDIGPYIGSSFPSNHAAIPSSLLPFLKNFSFIFWLLVCFYISLSRVYWQYHYFSDIFGGMFIAYLIGLAIKYFKPKTIKKHARHMDRKK